VFIKAVFIKSPSSCFITELDTVRVLMLMGPLNCYPEYWVTVFKLDLPAMPGRTVELESSLAVLALCCHSCRSSWKCIRQKSQNMFHHISVRLLMSLLWQHMQADMLPAIATDSPGMATMLSFSSLFQNYKDKHKICCLRQENLRLLSKFYQIVLWYYIFKL
jgi:hypothetical protein